MQPENNRIIAFIGIPTTGDYLDADNQVILAKLDLRNSEKNINSDELTIQSSPKWFQSEWLEPLLSGRQDQHRICAATVYANQLVLDIEGRSADTLINFELVLVPKATEELRLMLALYLAEVFDCLKRIEIYWGTDPSASEPNFEVVRQDVHRGAVLKERPIDPNASDEEDLIYPDKVTLDRFLNSPPSKIHDGINHQLEEKGWIKNGKAKSSKNWPLADYASYILILYGMAQDWRQLETYVRFWGRAYGMPEEKTIQKLLGKSPSEWVKNAQEWQK